jgi:hypothetical protein
LLSLPELTNSPKKKRVRHERRVREARALFGLGPIGDKRDDVELSDELLSRFKRMISSDARPMSPSGCIDDDIKNLDRATGGRLGDIRLVFENIRLRLEKEQRERWAEEAEEAKKRLRSLRVEPMSAPDDDLNGLTDSLCLVREASEQDALLESVLEERLKRHAHERLTTTEKFRFEFPTNFLNRNGLRRQQDREGLPAQPARADGEGATAQDPEHQASED